MLDDSTLNPIVVEVLREVFNDLYPGADGDPDVARDRAGQMTGQEILEASELVTSLGGVEIVKDLAVAMAEIPIMIIVRGGPATIIPAVRAACSASITAGAILSRRADAANAELPTL